MYIRKLQAIFLKTLNKEKIYITRILINVSKTKNCCNIFRKRISESNSGEQASSRFSGRTYASVAEELVSCEFFLLFPSNFFHLQYTVSDLLWKERSTQMIKKIKLFTVSGPLTSATFLIIENTLFMRKHL